jgi:YD repeat-containing protein
MEASSPVRCAIYTRVSTEQGLDQEFYSLDAQYDAASAYIKSQAMPAGPNPAEGEAVMRFIVALLLMSGTAMAQVQNRTFQDSMGRNTGRSVTDSRCNTTFYDAMGRNTGRSATSGNTTTTYDNMGRRTGSISR